MTDSPIFEIDRDTVRSSYASVTYKALTSNTATLTTSADHNFQVGWQVVVTGVDTTFNGTFTILSVTSNTFSYTLISNNVASTAVSPNGTAYSPSPAYVRYPIGDTALDNLTAKTTFYAEPWDYNTVRIVWGLDNSIHQKILTDVAGGLTPRVAITRSTFGYPVTPLDGEKIFDRKYMEVVSSPDNSGLVPNYFETQPASTDNDFQRPIASAQSFYDRNLTPGKWYYYSLFFYLQGTYASQRWVAGGQMDALLPINYKHSEKLWNLLPPYYQNKDREFTYGTGQSGVLERLLKTVGFEADYTRTLAEGIEDIYDVDHAHDDLLHALGVFNMGVGLEGGLGDIRYRSLLSTINKLYDERGSARGIQKMSLAASKYNCKVVEGANIMNLTDDAEFLTGTGAWANVVGVYDSFLASNAWLTAGNYWLDSTVTTFNPVSFTLNPTFNEGPSVRRGGVNIAKASGSNTGLLFTCGLGTGSVVDRLHASQSTSFYPQFNGIRCSSGTVYSFSFYSKRLAGSAANLAAGIMWFNLPANHSFSITSDFIGASKQVYLAASSYDSTSLTRYSVSASAPLSLRGESKVFAVPYIAYGNTQSHTVTGCMFNAQLNSADKYAIQPDFTLTLGGTAELLGSSYVIGDQ